jgi:hypothetical protein
VSRFCFKASRENWNQPWGSFFWNCWLQSSGDFHCHLDGLFVRVREFPCDDLSVCSMGRRKKKKKREKREKRKQRTNMRVIPKAQVSL